MHSRISSLVLCSLLTAVSAVQAAPPGYLLIKIEKVIYGQSGARGHTHTTQSQKFKVLMDANFLAQFNNPPESKLYCGLSDHKGIAPGMNFLEWFALRADGRLATWMWSSGTQVVNDLQINARNAVVTSTSVLPNWQALDLEHNQSFVNRVDGINLGFGVKWVSAGDPALVGALLAPVKKADGSDLVTGDSQDAVPFSAGLGFQR
jgi:hypothetical protein